MANDKDQEKQLDARELVKNIIAHVFPHDIIAFNPKVLDMAGRMVLLRDDRIRAEAKAEALADIESLKREIDLCYSMWTGRDYGHLPLHEALGKAMEDREAEALREAAERAGHGIAVACRDRGLPPGLAVHLWEAAESAILADDSQPSCTWIEAPEGYWSTSCGRSWTFIEGGPRENSVRYCHGCGKSVRIADEPNKEE